MTRKFNFGKKAEETPPDVPPSTSSPEVEKALLGCLLSNSNHIPHAAEYLSPDAFYGAVHKQIYEEIISFGTKCDAFDLVTFTSHMADVNLLDKVGGPAFLAELLTDIPIQEHYYQYSKILEHKMRLRQAWWEAEKIKATVASGGADFDELSVTVMDSLSNIRSSMEATAKERSWDDEIDEWSEDWDLMASGKKESSMSLRWPCWNSDAGGLQPGYNIISGTSSSGKSTLLGNIMADACIRNKRPGLYVSYEMPVRMVVSRLVADLADIDGMHLFQPDRSYPTPEIKKGIAEALRVIRKSSLRIIHQPRLSTEGVCHMARKMFVEQGDVVIGVDYLQLIPKPADIEKNANREREVASNSATLRTFSKEIDVPLITLSQLNADGMTRESGSVNMDCDSHFRVDRTKDNKTGKITEHGVWIAKCRNGRSDHHLPLFLEGSKFRFNERIKK